MLRVYSILFRQGAIKERGLKAPPGCEFSLVETGFLKQSHRAGVLEKFPCEQVPVLRGLAEAL